MIYGAKTLHRRYTLKNPEKYMERVAPPICKSSWEERIFLAMDVNPFITKWAYEPFSIYYRSPKFNKMSIYKPDIYCECNYANGEKQRYLIEIKPQKFSVMPKEPPPLKQDATAKQKRSYMKKIMRYQMQLQEVMVNQAKWSAAKEWCVNNHMNWLVLTEENMRGLFATNARI